MLYGRLLTLSMVPVPGVKPWTPYSIVHEEAEPFSRQLMLAEEVVMLEAVIWSTSGQSGATSRVMSSTYAYHELLGRTARMATWLP